MTFTVLATDEVSEPGLAALAEDDRFVVVRADDSSSSGFRAALDGSHALIVRSATRVTDEMMAMAPRLRVIGRAGVGLDNIDVAAASGRGVAVINAPNANTIAAAELTLALILAVVRRVPAADRSIREGSWDRAAFRGVELRGRTLGLIGAGRIGGEVALRCMAFGMDVIVYDPYLTPDRAEELGIALVTLDEVLVSSDVISIHVPLNEETRGMVDESTLERMKPGTYLVNASRGGVVDEAALASALADGRIAGAGLDVYEREPLPGDSPLRSAPNLVLTPHLGASTAEAQIGVAAEVAEGIRAILAGGDLSAAVNAAQLA